MQVKAEKSQGTRYRPKLHWL